jgi:Ca2+-binding EF-hand superfamily protein
VIVSRFERYDKDKSGELDASQVAEVLKDLNGGKAVTDDEVKWVIESTDGRVVSILPMCLLVCKPPPRAQARS